MNLITTINLENITPEESDTFNMRHAARAIVYDDVGKIALLNVTKKNYHKLPGGGVEEGEDLLGALHRECLEEIGCEIKAGDEIGSIVELKKDKYKEKQTSVCFIAEVVGDKGVPSFTQEENEDGINVMWVSLKDALQLLKSDSPSDYQGKFIIERDKAFILQAMKI